MNAVHRWCCRSHAWSAFSGRVLTPWALADTDLGASVLEIGPGFGANTARLRTRADRVTAVEIDPAFAQEVRRRHSHDAGVTVVDGDATNTGLASGSFTSAVCMTMLHHVATPELQDALFVEARRLLTPGGVLVGGDGTDNPFFAAIHRGDTYNPVETTTLTARLTRAGFSDIRLSTTIGALRFRATAPR